jgi:N-acetylneuraminic acid mutarotase
MAGLARRFAVAAAIVAILGACSAAATPTPSPAPSAAPATPSSSPTATATAAATPSPSATPTEPPAVPTTGTWAKLAVAGDAPKAREAHTWTVDPAGGVAYLFGGRDGATVFGDLWRFDLASERWQLIKPTGPAPAARFGQDAVWLPGRGLLVFAGQNGSAFYNDLWVFDPKASTWTKLPARGDPPVPRYGSCAVLTSTGHLFISHGFTEEQRRFFDSRLYDFATGEWTDATPTAGDLPVARCLHHCFESADGPLILFGGQTTGVPALGDLWRLDLQQEAASWKRIDEPLPAARNLYAFARTESAFIVFGGGSLERGYLSDTWAFSASDLTAAPLKTSGGPPPGRSAASFVEDAARHRLLLFGGRDAGHAFADVWSLELE